MIKWIKTDTQRYMSEDRHYSIVGRYTYYQGWEPYYLPDGERGEWIALDGMYKGKGALDACRKICDMHNIKTLTAVI
jgi:hypothetical protein